MGVLFVLFVFWGELSWVWGWEEVCDFRDLVSRPQTPKETKKRSKTRQSRRPPVDKPHWPVAAALCQLGGHLFGEGAQEGLLQDDKQGLGKHL